MILRASALLLCSLLGGNAALAAPGMSNSVLPGILTGPLHGGSGYPTPGDTVPPPGKVQESEEAPEESEEPDRLQEVRMALDEGNLEEAHRALSQLVAEDHLRAARETLAQGDEATLSEADLTRCLDLFDRAADVAPKGSPIAAEAGVERRAVGAALSSRLIQKAEAALQAGVPEDALVALDRALDLAPGNGDALLLRGRGFWDLGIKVGQAAYYEDSLANYREASAKKPEAAEAWFGAARAARNLYQPENALSYAREGLKRAGAKASPADMRITAQAAFDNFLAARSGDPGGDDTRAYFFETEDMLERLVAMTPTDPWGWLQLSILYDWAGSPSEAQARIERGLEVAPSSSELHQRFADLARRQGGSAAVLSAYDDLLNRFPDLAPAHFQQARELFSSGLEQTGAEAENDAQRFADAEAAFRRSRELDPVSYREPALGWEAVCRLASGWAHYHRGDLDTAKQSFLSMEDLFPGALEWNYGDLPPGTQSLEWVAKRYYDAQQEETRPRGERAMSMEKAAKIYDFLHEYRPQNTNWANNAGFMNRDVAEMYEQAARERARNAEAAREAGEDSSAAMQRAEEEQALSIELMNKSYRAYRDAAALAPNDVRIVNDTGLIPTYYLQNDLDRAEGYLLKSVELGEAQLAELNGSEGEEGAADRRYELENALGDAYQNLGVLYLRLRNQPEPAAEWFKKSEALGPDPRVLITDVFLPGCAEAMKTGNNPFYVTDEKRWDAPVSVRTSPTPPR